MKVTKSKRYSVPEIMDILSSLNKRLSDVRLQKRYSYTKEYHTLCTQIKYYETLLDEAMSDENV